LKQSPFDFLKTGVTPENGPFEIVRKTASLRAPAQSNTAEPLPASEASAAPLWSNSRLI